MGDLSNYIWVIFYVDKDHLTSLTKEYPAFGDIKFIVPTVKVIKKQFRGKMVIEEVPFLFNYGFVRIKDTDACNRETLTKIKAKIKGIHSWMWKNPKEYSRQYEFKVNRVKFSAILKLINQSRKSSIYSSDDVKNLKPGQLLELKGYPFDGMTAEFISANEKKELIKVKLLVGPVTKEVTVNFSNVFYTIYGDYEEPKASDNTSDALEFYHRKGIKKQEWDYE